MKDFVKIDVNLDCTIIGQNITTTILINHRDELYEHTLPYQFMTGINYMNILYDINQ